MDLKTPFPDRAGLAGLLLIALAGCTALQPTPTPTPAPNPPPTVAPTPTEAPQPMIVTLDLWLPEELTPYGDEPGAQVLAQQLADFSRTYFTLQVEVTVKKAQGEGGLIQFLSTARDAAPSVLPDLVIVDAADLETLAGANLVQPLDSLLAPDEAADRFSFAAKLGTVNGRTYGFVVGAEMEHLVYRPALLESPPVSWTQVISAPTFFLFPASSDSRQVDDATLIQYLAAGGQVTDQQGRPWLDEDALASVLGFYRDCTDAGIVSPAMVLNITNPDRAWEQFQIGAGGIAVVRSTRYWRASDATVAAAPAPTADGRPFTIAHGWVLALVTDDPPRQAMAMQLFDWLIAPERNAQWTQAAGYMPGTRSALRLWSMAEADRATWRSLMESAAPPPQPEIMAAIGPVMQEAVEAVLQNQSTPREAAADAVGRLGQ